MAEKGWFAVYTRSRYEKKVRQLLKEQDIDCYLPEVAVWKQWSDRRKKVWMPLIPSYIFVHIVLGDHHTYYSVLNTPGVVRFICFEGQAVRIPDHQVETLKHLNSQGVDMRYLPEAPPPGTPVMVERGSLKGLTGEVVRTKKNKQFLVLRIDCLDKCLMVDIPLSLVKPLKNKQEVSGRQ